MTLSDPYTEALKEAFVMAPAGKVTLDTLELRHSAFVDDDGAPTAIRAVRNHADTKTWIELGGAPVQTLLDGLSEEARDLVGLVAHLEASAPLDPGALVYFTAIGFELELPKVTGAPVPELSVSLDNVSDELDKHLSAAATSQEEIAVTYRPYLSTDLSGPQMDPPLHLFLTVADADQLRATGRASIKNQSQKGFPGNLFTVEDFPGLGRQG